ncbi:MAG: DUF2059 domain-containing protein [Bacteroidota bacterium]|nr:DUF2059 domain-containing protein [Bacteroidota bacterium]
MKSIIGMIMLLGFLLGAYCAKAQTGDYDKDLEKFLQISGSTSTYDMVYDQMKGQIQMMKPGVPDSIWVNLKNEVFDKEVLELTKQLVPLYQKHFTHEDVKEMISFYESPIGKKLAITTPIIGREAMQIGQTWGMNLMAKINGWLGEKGY